MVSLSFMLAGGISNLIDRIARGAVIDYIDISPIFKFSVFNLSDILILVGWIILVISIFTYWKEERSISRDLKEKKQDNRRC